MATQNHLGKVATTSADIPSENLQKLQEVFPQFVKDGVVDFDALQAFFDKENVLAGSEKYGLSWAGKSDAFKAIRVPATGTLMPDQRGVGEWDKTQNIFIEGDNLEVLKLLQKHYREQIKMIYIDPPYNTGKDFIYKDNFTENKSDYYERTGQSEGGVKLTSNPESNGRYHSDWLTMMYPRLFLAKNLLKDDGVIFISIDDNEVANLRLIMDEIFGEENFLAQVVWERAYSPVNLKRYFSESHDYVIVYARSLKDLPSLTLSRTDEANARYSNPDKDSRGPWKSTDFSVGPRIEENVYEISTPSGRKVLPSAGRSWVVSKTKYMELVTDNRIWFGVDGNSTPARKSFLSEVKEGITPMTLWKYTDVGHSQDATKELNELFGDNSFFDYPKPVGLIKRMIDISTSKERDIILDFFAGSGTTAHAVMAQNAEDGGNRKWICVQLPEETTEDSEARKAGYNTISEIAIDRIRRLASYPKMKEVIEKNERVDFDFGFKSFKLAPSNYRQWSVLTEKDDEAKLKAQMKLFADKPLVDGCNDHSVVYEVLLKEGFDLNAEVRQEEKSGVTIWSATSGDRKMVITLASKLAREQVYFLGLAKEDTFVCLDSALDDSLKMNLSKDFNLKVI